MIIIVVIALDYQSPSWLLLYIPTILIKGIIVGFRKLNRHRDIEKT